MNSEETANLIAGHAAATLAGVSLTLGYSPTVLRALNECWNRGALTGVFVAESRPLYEGRQLATALAERGIPTVLITEAQIGIFVAAATVAVVGAETIQPTGYLVNRVGTNLLAVAARRSRIPFYTLAETCRIAPARQRGSPFSLEDGDPAEVLEAPIPGVAVRNVIYDLTPARFIAGYITEVGLLNRREVAALARRAARS